jgi:hypothetical protein
MSVCVTTNYLDPQSIYPVIDPHRLAGSGPWEFGYALALDTVRITVERNPVLSRCEMRVSLTTTLTEGKEITAFNLFANNVVDRIGSAPTGVTATEMEIFKAGQPCEAGADTVVLCRWYAWPRSLTAMYTFLPQDFWDFWGGSNVNFAWLRDDLGSGLWGNQMPPFDYSQETALDRTLRWDGTNYRVVVGGMDFVVHDLAYLTAMGLDRNSAVPWAGAASFPADFTLVREFSHYRVGPIRRMRMWIVFGGAKFHIPDTQTLQALGFDPSQVNVIPEGGTSKLGTMPIDGTLLREQSSSEVFLAKSNQLLLVPNQTAMERNCLPSRLVRIVPDRALTALPRGTLGT